MFFPLTRLTSRSDEKPPINTNTFLVIFNLFSFIVVLIMILILKEKN